MEYHYQLRMIQDVFSEEGYHVLDKARWQQLIPLVKRIEAMEKSTTFDFADLKLLDPTFDNAFELAYIKLTDANQVFPNEDSIGLFFDFIKDYTSEVHKSFWLKNRILSNSLFMDKT